MMANNPPVRTTAFIREITLTEKESNIAGEQSQLLGERDGL